MGPAAIKRQPRSQHPEVTTDGLLNGGPALRVTKGMRGRRGSSEDERSVETDTVMPLRRI